MKQRIRLIAGIEARTLGRALVLGLVLAVAFLVGSPSFVAAQDQPAKPTLVFTNDAGLIIFYV